MGAHVELLVRGALVSYRLRHGSRKYSRSHQSHKTSGRPIQSLPPQRLVTTPHRGRRTHSDRLCLGSGRLVRSTQGRYSRRSYVFCCGWVFQLPNALAPTSSTVFDLVPSNHLKVKMILSNENIRTARLVSKKINKHISKNCSLFILYGSHFSELFVRSHDLVDVLLVFVRAVFAFPRAALVVRGHRSSFVSVPRVEL